MDHGQRRRPPLVILLIAAAAIAGGAALWHAAGWRGVTSSTALQTPLRPRLAIGRLFEPRIAGVRAHRPFETGREAHATPDLRIAIAELELFARALPPGAEASNALGVVWLYKGRVDEAIERLADARDAAPDRAEYWSDLAAAALVRNRPTDLLVALDASEQALQIDGTLAAARFNRALALERLGLLGPAAAEWRALAAPAGSTDDAGWSAEARAHADITARLVAAQRRSITLDELLQASPASLTIAAQASVDEVRQMFEDELLPRIGRACRVADDAACAPLMRQMEAIADAVTQASADRQTDALRLELKRWVGTTARRAEIADMLQRHSEAKRLADADQAARAAALFAQVGAALREPFPTLAANVDLQICIDAYLRSAHDQARGCLDRLARSTPARFAVLQARIDWIRAQISLTEADFARALREFERSLALLGAAGERNQRAVVASLQATLLDQLGELDDAWRARIEAAGRARLPPRRWHTLFNSAARSCLLQGLPRAALRFQEESLASDERWQRPGAIAETLLNRALLLRTLGRSDAAHDDLERARAQLARVDDERLASRFRNELFLTEGELLADSSPARAVPILSAALSHTKSMQFDLVAVRLQRALGVALERLGRPDEAIAAYRAGTDLIERQRHPLASPLRTQMLDVAWDIYERLIARQLDRDRTGAAALATVERSRAADRPPIAQTQAASRRSTTGAAPIEGTSIEKAAGEKAPIEKTSSGKGPSESALIEDRPIGDASIGHAANGEASLGAAARGSAAIGNTAIGNTAIANTAIDDAAIGNALRALPAGATVLYFAVMEQETVRWTIEPGGLLRVRRMAVGRSAVDRMVREMRRAMTEADDGPQAREAAARASAPLFDLVMPDDVSIAGGSPLVVIPDGALYELPIGALIDPRTGRYLIEAHPVAIAPNLAMFLSASASARDRHQSLRGALIVEGETGAVTGDAALPHLPAAGREVRRIVAMYGRSRLLTGATATPAEFLASAGAYEVVHFAGHAIANRVQPELSRLYLGGARREQPWLTVRDLESGSFGRTALVVLSACETGMGRVYRGEGVVSLARPFLQRGVPGVVNTLWKVEDGASAALLEAFHARVSAGVEPLLALREAQLAQLRQPRAAANGASAWAAFQYVGGLRLPDAQGAQR